LGNAGNISLTTNGIIEFDNSRLFSNIEDGGEGRAGDITIKSVSLSLLNGSQIQSGINPGGQGSDISQVAIDVQGDMRIAGHSPTDRLPSSIFTDVLTNEFSETRGDASNITITSQTGSIFLEDGALLRSSNTSDGLAGDIVLNARDRVSINNSGIESKGDFGRILIGKSEISGETSSPRIVNLNNSTLSTTNDSVEDFSDIPINAKEISIDAIESIFLGEQSRITSSTWRFGNAGDIFLTTNGIIEFDNSRLFSNVNRGGAGRAGDITIKAGSLNLLNGSQLQSGINSGGQGNDISQVTIDVQGDVRITGRSPTDGLPSSIFTDVSGLSETSGNASNITITSQRGSLILDGGLLYSANASGGTAGNIKVTAAKDIRLDNGAEINADTTRGQGNITLNSRDLILRRNSNITTNAEGFATGGNINIKTGNLVAVPKEDSNISANATEGFGGEVRIDAQGIFGIKSREQPTSESDITASSERGAEFSGTVDLNNPDVDPSRGLIELPENVIDPSTQIAQNPCQRGVGSEFTVTGRGGLPPSPNQTLSNDSVRVGLVTPVPSTANTAATNATSSPEGSTASKILPAQGWVFNNKGEVMLTAYDPTNSSVRGSRYNPATCVAK
jgi:large exoprotein involved in heme utilization and adhesion